MKHSRILASAFTLALILLPSFLLAAPNTLSYNGKLSNKDGSPLEGSKQMKFTVCDSVTGGTCPWEEQRNVTFSKGVFSIQLGEVTPLPATLFENNDLYLSVSLFDSGTTWETFTPRQSLTAAPFAMNANDVLKKDISPRSVSINGYGTVIDETGKWVGASGPMGATGGVKVYDATGQYLGLFMGEEYRRIQIFIPTLKKILSLSKEDGTHPVTPASTGYIFYYKTNNCQGQPYQMLEQDGSQLGPHYSTNGWLYENKFHYMSDSYRFYASSMIGEKPPLGSLWAMVNQNGAFTCVLQYAQISLPLSPITLYTEADLPFTFPLSFPLSFKVE